MPTLYFVKNLDLIFFVYGLAFVIMGVSILIQPRFESIFKLSRIIWLLAAFGITHGVNEWLDMFSIIKGPGSPFWIFTGRIILILSYLFLFEFGRRLLRLAFKDFFITRWVAIVWYSLVFIDFYFLPIDGMSAWPRYFLGLPAAVMTALT